MISIQNISKYYRLRHGVLSKFRGRSDEQEVFWALRGISLEVAPGSVLGIVGPNGSGKSTLLQIVAGIMRPTSGRVLSSGRISALLELGAGFNPEFTGRENVILSAQLNGMPNSALGDMAGEVEAFSELGKFFDRPVKEYSTGMYVRLAFSAAIHGAPEILIVDEALAVGDARFANRCIQRLDQLRANLTTILFVSHDLGLVRRLCDQAALLWRGSVVAVGSPGDVAKDYTRRVQSDSNESESVALRMVAHNGHSFIRSAKILNSEGLEWSDFDAGQSICVQCQIEVNGPGEAIQFGVLIRNRQGVEVFGTNSRLEGVVLGPFEEACCFGIRFDFPCRLVRGEYTVTLATQFLNGVRQDWQEDCCQFRVLDLMDYVGIARLDGIFTVSPS